MKNILFLATKTYPFGKGEEYLSSEIWCLSKSFNKILLYPNDYYQSDLRHNRDLPENVQILNLNVELGKNSKRGAKQYFYLLFSCIREVFETDCKFYLIKNLKWSLINFWTQYQISFTVENYLKQNEISNSNTVFYSYWFNKSALLFSILKERGIVEKIASRAHSIDLYHNDWGFINKNIKVPPFKMLKIRNTDLIVPISQHGQDYLTKKYSTRVNRVQKSYLGVSQFMESRSENLQQDSFHIATCSGVDSNKRIHLLLEALSKVKHNVRWTHFGQGAGFDSLDSKKRGLPPNIVCQLMGQKSNCEVLKFYAIHKINLFVNLSIVEGLPVSIMEAMQFKMAILATKVYGTPEAVIDGENGFLVPVDFTTELLIEKLNYCIENTDVIKMMGEKSHEYYLQKFNSEKNYKEFTELLTSV